MHRWLILSLFAVILIGVVLLAPLPTLWQNLLLGFAFDILATVVAAVFVSYSFPYRLILTSLLSRGKIIRVSIAGLLKLTLDGKYVLIKQARRPGQYGPIGGVYKYYSTAISTLAELDFVQDYEGFEGDPDLERDLRGFVPAANALRFLRWFWETQDRERDVIGRELGEELMDSGLIKSDSVLRTLQFRLIRSTHDVSFPVPGAIFVF